MAFWVDWPLWEQLSFVLALLVALVFVYATCVLAFNTWKTRRYADAEARQKLEDAELYPMLSRDDVPFGAKALQRGVQVEGIWVSSPNTPLSSTFNSETPSTDQPPSHAPRKYPVRPPTPASSVAVESAKNGRTSLPADTPAALSSEEDFVSVEKHNDETRVPGDLHTSGMLFKIPSSPNTFNRPSQDSANEKRNNPQRASFHSRIWHAGQVFDTEPAADRGRQEMVSAQSHNGPVSHSLDEQRRASRISRVLLRKRSSEEFRRKMSAIFNERIHMNMPTEGLEIEPSFRRTGSRHKRRSILTQSRSWGH